MKTKTVGSLFVLLAIATTVPMAFADHPTSEVSLPVGSAVPGCEETNECYIPEDVTVDVGGEVTWSNDDNAAHTVTSGTPAEGPDGAFDSSLFMAGATFSHTFDTEGVYPYFCMVHPWMVGTVTVEGHAAAESADEDMEMDMSVPSEVSIVIDAPTTASSGERVSIDVEFLDEMGMNVAHSNYDIVATHNGETILSEESVHNHEGSASHTTPALTADASDDNPLDITVTFQGIGLPDDEKVGPVGVTASVQVVPEFGAVAVMVLGVAIVSIIAVTAKTRVIPRL